MLPTEAKYWPSSDVVNDSPVSRMNPSNSSVR